jgi:uncharacterized membrane protein YbhN (UPF0104 family)
MASGSSSDPEANEDTNRRPGGAGALSTNGSAPRVQNHDRPRERREHAPDHPGGPRQFFHEHRRAIVAGIVVLLLIIFIFVVLPQLAGFGKSLHRLKYGNKLWLAVGVCFEACSLLGYATLFKTLFSYDDISIGWRDAGQITLSGTVATKLLGAGGAGGIALTVWALRAAGHSARTIAHRMTSFEIMLYGVFMAALVIFGGGIAIGVLPGPHKPPLTVLPAVIGAAVIALVTTVGFAADGVTRWLLARGRRSRRHAAWYKKVSTVPRTLHDGVVNTWEILRHPRPGHIGAIMYWAFDIATLWAAFRAFGAAPLIPVIVLSYFIGQMASILPIPGGIGSIEGGMLGIFIAFGESGSTAALAVIAFSLLSIWLPVLPGSIAYFRLRASVAKWREE